jgi:catechol 2,3-dioxygenase-like lactoylglutathione lyase family enzyme
MRGRVAVVLESAYWQPLPDQDAEMVVSGRSTSERALMSLPRMSLSGIVLDSPDARELAGFYQRLLGWRAEQDEPGWVKLASPEGGPGLSFQTETAYRRPRWPTDPADSGDPADSSVPAGQQMMIHLDIKVEDLDEAGRHAVAAGAVLADYQPQDDVRVYLDPAGHPFCLFLH